MDNELLILLIIYSLASLSAFIGVIIRHNYNANFLKTKKYNIVKNFKCNLMCFIHFIMYILLGYYAPTYWYISFILSILWEYIEVYLEKNNILVVSNLINDIITNMSGLIVGIILNKYI